MFLKKFVSYLVLYLCFMFVFHFGASMASEQGMAQKPPVEIVPAVHEGAGQEEPALSEKHNISVREDAHDTHTQSANNLEYPQGDAETNGYRLGAGDELKITVYGEDVLSQNYKVSDKGFISVPLVGEVMVAGRTLPQVTKILTEKLSQGYIKNPDVSIEVSNFRPVYVMGEVRNPGSYEYVADMTILNAVVIAGGYTYRADKDEHDIMRDENGISKVLEDEPETVKIHPGDIILVKERFF